MVQDKKKDIVFLPIKPKYAREIMNGNKTVEFRKRFPVGVKKVVVYSSSPQQKILGWFDVDCVDVLSPKTAWIIFNDEGCILEKDFFKYYENSEYSSVIIIKKVYKFSDNIPTVKKLGITPPQSFFYVSDSVWETLQEYK